MFNEYSSSQTGILKIAFLGFFLWFTSYLYMYVFQVGGGKPLYSYVLFFAFSVFSFLVISAHRRRSVVLLDGSIKYLYFWLFLYTGYTLFQSFRNVGDPESTQSLISALEMVLVAVCAIYLLSSLRAIKQAAVVCFVVVFISVLINFWDFLEPTFSEVPGRAAGFYENPTIAGNIIAMAMVPAMLALPTRLRFWFGIFCGFGVLATFSRGAWIVWGVGFFMCIYAGVTPLRAKNSVKLLFAATLGVVTAALVFSGTLGALVAGTGLEQYLTPSTMARLGIGSEVLSGVYTSARYELIWASFSEWAEAPLFGHGLGATSAWELEHRPHNMYLLFLVEGGLFGLFLFSMLLWILWWGYSNISSAFTLQFAASGFFTHNNLEQPAVLLLIAFVVVYGAGYRKWNDARS